MRQGKKAKRRKTEAEAGRQKGNSHHTDRHANKQADRQVQPPHTHSTHPQAEAYIVLDVTSLGTVLKRGGGKGKVEVEPKNVVVIVTNKLVQQLEGGGILDATKKAHRHHQQEEVQLHHSTDLAPPASRVAAGVVLSFTHCQEEAGGSRKVEGLFGVVEVVGAIDGWTVIVVDFPCLGLNKTIKEKKIARNVMHF